MTFLIIVIGLFFLRFGGLLRVVQQDNWYVVLDRVCHRLFSLERASLATLFAIVLPVILVLFLSRWLDHGLLGSLLSLFLFLYALGRGDLQQQIDDYVEDMTRNDVQAAFHDEAALNPGHKESDAVNCQELHENTVKAIVYRYFEHFFAVIFWFILAGPAGALLYRLIQLRIDMPLEGADQSCKMVAKWLKILEWVPVRLFGMTFALVGDFANTIKPWLNTLFSTRESSMDVLGSYTAGALGLGEAGVSKVAEITQVKALLYRSLVCAVTLIALWVLFV